MNLTFLSKCCYKCHTSLDVVIPRVQVTFLCVCSCVRHLPYTFALKFPFRLILTDYKYCPVWYSRSVVLLAQHLFLRESPSACLFSHHFVHLQPLESVLLVIQNCPNPYNSSSVSDCSYKPLMLSFVRDVEKNSNMLGEYGTVLLHQALH